MSFNIAWSGKKEQMAEFESYMLGIKALSTGQAAQLDVIQKIQNYITPILNAATGFVGVHSNGHYDAEGKGSHSISLSIYG